MRAIMSPSGSFNAIARRSLPARLDQARDQALGTKLPERDAAHFQLAIKGFRAARNLAAVVNARGRRITRQLGKLEGGREAVLGRPVLVAGDRLKPCPPARELPGQPAAPVVLLDRALLRHSGLLNFRV